MRNRFTLLLFILALPFPGLWPLSAAAVQEKVQFEKALLLEETQLKFEEAIRLYSEIVEGSNDPSLAALSQLRIGLCYEKLGKQEARKAFEAVLEKYPSEAEPVRLAREGLERLGMGSVATGTTVENDGSVVRELFRTEKYVPGEISNPAVDPSWFSVSKDGRQIAHTDWMSGDLVIYNLAAGSTKGLYGIDFSRSPEAHLTSAFSPDGSLVAFGWESWGEPQRNAIRIDSVNGGQLQSVVEIPTSEGWIAQVYDWHPTEGKILAGFEPGPDDPLGRNISTRGPASPELGNMLVQLDVKNGQVEGLVATGSEFPNRAQYSLDGRTIVFDSNKTGRWRIYIASADGSQERLLRDSAGDDAYPIWSPNGRHLIFKSNQFGDWDLLAERFQDGYPQGKVLTIQSSIGASTILRGMTDRGQLYYSQKIAGPEIFLWSRNGSEKPVSLQKAHQVQMNPRFSNDGKQVIYISNESRSRLDPKLKLVVADLNGSPVREIDLRSKRLSSFASSPFISPDGSKVAIMGRDRSGDRSKNQLRVLIFSYATGQILTDYESSDIRIPRAFGWSADSQLFYVTKIDEQRRLFFVGIDILSGQEEHRHPLPEELSYLVVSPDGNRYFFQNRSRGADKEVLNVQEFSDGVHKEFELGSMLAPRWDYDSKHILFNSSDDPLTWLRLSIDTGTTEVFLRTEDGAMLHDTSPDGKYALFGSGQVDYRIRVLENFLPEE